jgi:heterodisulfide reductase subunit B
MEKAGHEIIVVSARNERHREVTENSLQEAGVQFQHLFLRPDGDFRKDSEFKQEVLDALIAQDWKPNLVFDDRNQVVAMWRSNGLTCVQVAEGDF